MTTKIIETDTSKILKGINKASDIISSTMSIKGKNVIISANGKQRFTQDGVSVARALKFEDPIENIGAQLVISSCQKTVDECGDGTTLTALLVKEFAEKVTKQVASGGNINTELATLENTIKQSIDNLIKGSKKVKSVQKIKELATVAGKSLAIGKLFAEIYKDAGFNANIRVETTDELDYTTYDVRSGFELNSGYAHSAFMTDKNTEHCIYENVLIKTFDVDLSKITDELEQLIGTCKSKDIPLLILAPKFGDSVIRYCTMAKVNSGAKIVLVKSGGWAEMVKRNILDVNSFANQGYVERIFITPFTCTLYNSLHEGIVSRVNQLKALQQSSIELVDKHDYTKRIDNLLGTGVTIFVGGVTTESRNEEFDRIEDAVGAVKSALIKGYVEGCGYALFCAFNQTDNAYLDCFRAPFKKILFNANIIMDRIQPYNIITGEYVETYESIGIIDSLFTIERALWNAYATVKLLTNTTYTLYNETD